MRLYQASSTRWAYDRATMIAEYNSSNALLRGFMHGPGVDEPIGVRGRRAHRHGGTAFSIAPN